MLRLTGKKEDPLIVVHILGQLDCNQQATEDRVTKGLHWPLVPVRYLIVKRLADQVLTTQTVVVIVTVAVRLRVGVLRVGSTSLP